MNSTQVAPSPLLPDLTHRRVLTVAVPIVLSKPLHNPCWDWWIRVLWASWGMQNIFPAWRWVR